MKKTEFRKRKSKLTLFLDKNKSVYESNRNSHSKENVILNRCQDDDLENKLFMFSILIAV